MTDRSRFLPAVQVSDELRRMVDDDSELRGISRGAVIRQALVFFFSQRDSYAIASHRLAIGRDQEGGDKQQRGM